ncbi:MAG: hypothetical protein QOJ29_3515 [Thermoleophilaceae bacterium]|nr:hypothetical protein [Thermoleophilaceae bacterium]
MSGGFFEQPRLWTALIVWVVVAIFAITGQLARPDKLAIGGLAALAAWTTASIAWSPLRDAALADSERVLLYAGYMLLAASLLRGRAAALTSPALAAGTVVVAGYALATRLLPTLVPSERSLSAGARLDQPLTYWNALGAVMAFGIVLLLQLASDQRLPDRARTLATTAVPVNGLALYLTFSRGSLAALATGLIVLVALTRNRHATAVVVVGLASSGAIAAVASTFAGVDSLAGTDAARRNDGLAVLAALLVICAVAALAERALRRGALDRLASRGLTIAAVIGVLAAVAGAAFIVARDPSPPPRDVPSAGANLPTTRARLSTLQSNRYDYWKVALDGFGDHPIAGIGAHGFQQQWLQRRTIRENAQDAHSLYLETATELGIIGLVFLGLFLAGAGRALLAVRNAGWIAASACWLVHAGIDWDWEMPTVSLLFLALAGAALGTASEQLVERNRG